LIPLQLRGHNSLKTARGCVLRATLTVNGLGAWSCAVCAENLCAGVASVARMSGAISGSFASTSLPRHRGACHRAALRADPLAHVGYLPLAKYSATRHCKGS
jgi:hypothetical protein